MLAACTFVVAVVGGLVAHQSQADRFDQALDAPVIDWFAHRPGLAALLATPGGAVPAAIMSAVLVAACLWARRLDGALLALTAVPVAVGVVELLLKPLVDRTYDGVLAYPSGHTTAVSALAATITILLLAPGPRARGRSVRVAVCCAAYLVVGVVAAAVVGLRWHYLTDTIGGATLGVATAGAIALALDRVLPGSSSDLARRRSRLGRARRAADPTGLDQPHRGPRASGQAERADRGSGR